MGPLIESGSSRGRSPNSRPPLGEPPLVEEIAARIRARGPISFAEFMGAALYHPEHGYYTSGGRAAGSYGADFRTSPQVHRAFGEMIARQAVEMYRRLEGPVPFRVVELGPGTGCLVRGILPELDRSLGERAWDYHLVEVSPALAAIQRESIADLPSRVRERALWSSPEDLAAHPADGLVLSNEFFDALPVHRVRAEGGDLQELRVDWSEARGFFEVASEVARPELTAYLDRYGVPLASGAQAEIGLELLDWTDRAAAMLRRGYLLTVDYGYPAEKLYSVERTAGTLMAYHRHTAGADPLRRVGQQDLTAHVNFSALERRGAERGFRSAPLRTQTQFLLGLGIVDRLGEIERSSSEGVARLREREAIKELFVPGGMGETFRVLVQGREAPLDGLAGLSSPWERTCAPGESG